ncbi:MAG: hypothetical protein R3D27_03025 [Hyphomicrobiaceae bacterium]
MAETDRASGVPDGATMWDEFNRICDSGGRLSGTPSEQGATALLETARRAATGATCKRIATPYAGWRAVRGRLLAHGEDHACKVLVRSAATPPAGVEAEVVDLGRGTPRSSRATPRRSAVASRLSDMS